MKKLYKIILIVVLIIFGLLLLTNPSMSTFKDFTADYSFTRESYKNALYHLPVRKKISNGFIFSVYQLQIYQGVNNQIKPVLTRTYLGMLCNFFPVSGKPSQKNNPQPKTGSGDLDYP